MQNNDIQNGASADTADGLKKIGVILMTYGSATTAEHVREYMDHIYRGKAPDGIVEDFERRYDLVGHSPLVEITEGQARALEDVLKGAVVRAGMLHSKPFIADAIRDCRNEGAERCVGIILSPQFSTFIMDGYGAAFGRAVEANGFAKGHYALAGPWPTEPHFIRLLAERVKKSLDKIRDESSAEVAVIFTTHSLPKRVVDKNPSYLDQLKSTTDAVLECLRGLDVGELEWHSAYQSAGHTPEEWLKPDLTDVLAELGRKKTQGKDQAVLIVPIQFLADHLEILYDLDIAARTQCEERGIAYHRIGLPNTDPLFIEALATVAHELAGKI